MKNFKQIILILLTLIFAAGMLGFWDKDITVIKVVVICASSLAAFILTVNLFTGGNETLQNPVLTITPELSIGTPFWYSRYNKILKGYIYSFESYAKPLTTDIEVLGHLNGGYTSKLPVKIDYTYSIIYANTGGKDWLRKIGDSYTINGIVPIYFDKQELIKSLYETEN